MVIVCAKFDRNQTIPVRVTPNLANFLLELRLVVTLTFDPLTLNFCGHSGVLCSNSVKFEKNRTIRCRVIDDLAHYRCEIFQRVAFTRKDLRGAWTDLHQTWRGHTSIISAHRVCFRVEVKREVFCNAWKALKFVFGPRWGELTTLPRSLVEDCLVLSCLVGVRVVN